jgi:cell division transport system permease protein
VHAFYLREAWRSFKQHRGLSYTALFSLTAALTLSAVLVVLAYNADVAMRMLGDRRELVVYLRDDVSDQDRQALMDRLTQHYGHVTYVSKDQAWQEFSDQVGDPELLEAVEGNPLPASLRVRLRPELLNHNAMEETARQVTGFPEVEDVRYGGEWVRRLDDLGTGLQRGAVAVGIVVALAVLFILYNTIRLTVLARRTQVEIMSRLGASDAFVAAPFVIEATLIALLASALALALAFGFHAAFGAQVVHVVYLPLPWTALFLGITVLLAWVAAMLALTRVLRAVGP